MKYIALSLTLGIVLIGTFNSSTPEGEELRKQSRLVAPPKELIYFTFGYNENISDGLWLRVLQDFDRTCGPESAQDLLQLAESDRPNGLYYRDDINEEEIGGKPAEVKFCNKTWVYHMLDRITDITPRFRFPYVLGATVLSVSANDIEGARLMFEKGIKQFPDDWILAYRAAYHYIYEVGDMKRAADLLIHAGKQGAPPWVFSLASRLYSKSGQLFLAKTVLEDSLKTVRDERVHDRIRDRLKEVNEAIEKLAKRPKEPLEN